MSLESQTVYRACLGDASTVAFDTGFTFQAETDILVGVDGVVQTSGYTVSGAGAETGGTVTFSTTHPGSTIVLLRKPPATQLVDYSSVATATPDNINDGMDKLTMLAQYMRHVAARSVRLSDLDASELSTVPGAGDRSSKLLGFDTDGDVTLYATGPTALAVASRADAEAGVDNSAYMTPLRAHQAAAVASGYRYTTAAALRASTEAYPSVRTDGYAAPGDGGGGHWWYDSSDTTSVDNGGTVVVSASGYRYKRSEASLFCDPRWFGASSDARFVVSAKVSLASGSTTLTVPGAAFTEEDVGKCICVPGAGASNATLFTTISSVTSSTVCELAAAASTTIPVVSATFTASIAGTSLVISAVASGAVWAGDVIVSGAASGTTITGTGSASGYAGTYTVDTSQTVSSTTMSAVSPTVVTWGTDDTTPVQDAIDVATASGVPVVLPPSGLYCTSAIALPARGVLLGTPMNLNPDASGYSQSFSGSWLFIGHSGYGIQQSGAGGRIEKLGIVRAQPAARVGWAPAANGYDIYGAGSQDVDVFDVTILNPTYGISFTSGGRWRIENLRGAPMLRGIYIDNCQDVFRPDNIHFWPFWCLHPIVFAYTSANAEALVTGRCDNPQIGRIFCIFQKRAWRIIQTTSGTTYKAQVGSIDGDYCSALLSIDSGVNGSTVAISNVMHHGSASASSRAFLLQGSNCIVLVGNTKSTYCGAEFARIDTGTGNTLAIQSLIVDAWAQDTGAINCFYATARNTIEVANPPIIGANGGSGSVVGGGGAFKADLWLPWTPTVTSGTGTLTTVGTISCQYKILGDTVHCRGYVSITDIGTGASNILLTPPYFPYGVATFTEPSAGVGREINLTGKSLSVTGLVGGSAFGIQTYDNAFPAVSGCKIVFSFSYLV